MGRALWLVCSGRQKKLPTPLLLSVFSINGFSWYLKRSYSYIITPQWYIVYIVISFGLANVNWKKKRNKNTDNEVHGGLHYCRNTSYPAQLSVIMRKSRTEWHEKPVYSS
jgi:hypothetical protein